MDESLPLAAAITRWLESQVHADRVRARRTAATWPGKSHPGVSATVIPPRNGHSGAECVGLSLWKACQGRT